MLYKKGGKNFVVSTQALDSTVDNLSICFIYLFNDTLFSPSINLDFFKCIFKHVFGISSLFHKYFSVYIISAEYLLFIFLLGEFMYKEIYDVANICQHLCTSSPFQGIKYYHHFRESLIPYPS